ncbi:MAG TPA: CdaR family protein [Desulfovibrio sp.]|jgi:YbbR domain-containing protein|uniref:CdaR family protein n=1 Tax=Desulfovibrio TaxID=872 RepID=UPI00041C6A5B|nr:MULTISPECIES: CdaR family protein [Desulfovibrio]MDY0306895.1 CdaR family protein [Desulfovibrionaceae bacterium]HMM37264.1 CdaR family protein [Desulfovibrio sp.]
MRKNWQYILLAVFLAVSTWYLVTGREKVEVWVSMNVEMTNPPSGLTIRKGMVSTIEVRVRGPKGLVRGLDAKRLSYPLDVRQLKVGENLIDIDAERMPFSRAFEVVEIRPNQVVLTVDRMAEKTVPVSAEWSGQVPADYRLLSKKVVPDEVTLRGPEGVLRRLTQAKATAVVSYEEDPPEVWDENVSLTLPPEVSADPGLVRMILAFGVKTKELWIKIPLDVRASPGLKVRPSRDNVRLLVEGPQALLRTSEFKKDIHAAMVVDPGLRPGKHELNYQVRGLPDKVRVLKRDPETVTVTIPK